jgi:Protein of unknown function (DUF3592)
MSLLIVALLGLIVSITSISKFLKNLTLFKQGEKTSRVVTKLNRSQTGKYHPTIKFMTVNGEWISFISYAGFYKALAKEGENVKVIYDSRFPHRAEIDSKLVLFYLPIFFGIGGIILTIYGLIKWIV